MKTNKKLKRIPDGQLAIAHGRDFKGKISLAMYVAAIPLSLLTPWIGIAIIIAVAVLWLIPDNRIVRTLEADRGRSRPPATEAPE